MAHQQQRPPMSNLDLQMEYGMHVDGLSAMDDMDSLPPPPPPSDHPRAMRDEEETRELMQMAIDVDDEEMSVEVDPPQGWLDSIGSVVSKGGRNHHKILIASVLCFAASLLITISVIVAARNNNNDDGPSSRASSSNSALTSPPGSTAAPTVAPTAASTIVSTVATTEEDTQPEDCVNIIAAGAACYTTEDYIDVVFQNCEPEPYDWIGVWSTEDGLDTEPWLWYYACGTQGCATTVESGEVQFGYGILSEGTYYAVLLRMDEASAPYTSEYATSVTFTVGATC
eukprot:Nitzschia sp. Nitz4//scaffold101_size76361//33657//34508//NITZ4_005602-RA/size76361-processed-gene-0.36-mRNA-1//-1//CDS//3329532158//8831//frame0